MITYQKNRDRKKVYQTFTCDYDLDLDLGFLFIFVGFGIKLFI